MEESEEGGTGERRIFVYGTLKRGFPNHNLLEDLISGGDATFIGPHTTVETYPLVCGPHGIPYLINLAGSGNCVGGELYSVSSGGGGLAILDELEGIHRGHYERLPVTVVGEGEGVVEAEAYFADRGFGEGLWRRCGEEGGLSEYSVEMGEKYVCREDRPPDSDFVADLHAFIAEEDGN